MQSCHQFRDMTVLDHGHDVRGWYTELRDFLLYGAKLRSSWVLPAWITELPVCEALAGMDDDVMRLYQIYHDCGKPECRTVDEDGRQHFPDHAATSKRVWLENGGSEEVAELIGMDMDAHLLKPEGVAEFASRPQAIPLLVTALCELHSNAQMFGGIESEGFKIKFKRLSRRGLEVLKAIVAQRKSQGL